MQDQLSQFRRALFAPIPHTPPVEKFLPRLETLRRALALALAIVMFHSQVLCAGTTSLPLWPSAQGVVARPGFLTRLIARLGGKAKQTPYLFRDSMSSDRRRLLHPEEESGVSPDTLKRLEGAQNGRADIAGQNQLNTGFRDLENARRPDYATGAGALGQINELEKALTPADLALCRK
jgi:hypothetical protein